MSYSKSRKWRIRIAALKKVLEADVQEMKEVAAMGPGMPKLRAIARTVSKEPPKIELTDDKVNTPSEPEDDQSFSDSNGHRKSRITLRL